MRTGAQKAECSTTWGPLCHGLLLWLARVQSMPFGVCREVAVVMITYWLTRPSSSESQYHSHSIHVAELSAPQYDVFERLCCAGTKPYLTIRSRLSFIFHMRIDVCSALAAHPFSDRFNRDFRGTVHTCGLRHRRRNQHAESVSDTTGGRSAEAVEETSSASNREAESALTSTARRRYSSVHRSTNLCKTKLVRLANRPGIPMGCHDARPQKASSRKPIRFYMGSLLCAIGRD